MHAPKRARGTCAGVEPRARATTPLPSETPMPPPTPLDLLAGVADRIAVGPTHTSPTLRRALTTTTCAPAVAATGREMDALCDRSNTHSVQPVQPVQPERAPGPLSALPPSFFAHAFSSVRALVSALETDATRWLLCKQGSSGGRVRAAALDEMFRSAPIGVIQGVCPNWRTDETMVRALTYYGRNDILLMRQRGDVCLAATCPKIGHRNEVVLWCETVLVTAASVGTVEAAEGLGFALRERAFLLQCASTTTQSNVQVGVLNRALSAFASTLLVYRRGSVGGRMLDALSPSDVLEKHTFASKHHASLCELASTGTIERVASANFVLALLERATASAEALECFRQWTGRAYGTITLEGLLLALQRDGAVLAEIVRAVGCLATVRDVGSYAWVERQAVDGEWLHAIFSRASQSESTPWSAWGATCTRCDAGSHGKAPIVAIATLAAAVGLEPMGRAHGVASNEVIRLALGSLIAWLSDVAQSEEMEALGQEADFALEDLGGKVVGPVAAKVARWVAALLWKVSFRSGALVEAAARDVVDDAKARGAVPPSMKILEGAMASVAALSPMC